MTATAARRLGLFLVLIATLLVAALVLIGRAGADDGDRLPAPANLQVSTERGSLDVSLDWDDVQGADSYRVRWRVSGPGNQLNDGISVQSSNAVITVARFREWVARVQACDSSGCGAPIAKKFRVRRPRAVPDITPLPTDDSHATMPTSTPTPIPTATTAPNTLRVSATASSVTPQVSQPVTLTASVSNAPPGSGPFLRMGVGQGRRLVLAWNGSHTHISRGESRAPVVQGNGELRVRGFGDIGAGHGNLG